MSFRIQTTSLTLSGDWLFSFHFDLLSSVGRYSLTIRFQKWFIICCRFRHVLKLAGVWLSNFPGGRELNGRLIKKWLGVRGISLSGRTATFVRGLEFKMASLSASIDWNTSSESRFEPRMISSVFFRCLYQVLPNTAKVGAIGRVEFPSRVCSSKSLVNFVVVKALYTFLQLF